MLSKNLIFSPKWWPRIDRRFCHCEFGRTALSVRPDKILASSMDDKFSGVVDENEGYPRVQRMIHSKFRRCAVKLFDYECRKTHGYFP
jgi:hypothetical protein